MKFFRWIYARLVFYPTLLWNLFNARVLKRRNWWDAVDETTIIGALPFASHVEEFKSMGVTGVVNTCEEYPGPVAEYEAAGIEQLRLPTIDFTHPSLESVQEAVDFVQRHADAGGRVYIHCKAGRARSATVVVCWLIHDRDLSPEDAQAFLKDRRNHVNPNVFRRPVVGEFVSSKQSAEGERADGPSA